MTRQQILRSIIMSIRNHKEQAEQASAQDMASAMNNKDFRRLEYEKREIMKAIAVNEVSGINSDKLNTRYNKITNELKKMADKLKLFPFSPKYDCMICKDTGYLDGSLCKCAKTILFYRLKELSGINSKIINTFASNDEEAYRGSRQECILNKLYSHLKEYSKAFPDVNYLNLVLCGGTGTGKTYALSALGNSIMDRGYELIYLTAFDMHNSFLRYHTAPFDEKFIHIDSLLEADMLIIDDLGTEPIFKNVTREYLYLILEERMINRLHTSISTNLQPEQILDRYGERIFSRLIDKRASRLINIDGDDLRLIKRKVCGEQ